MKIAKIFSSRKTNLVNIHKDGIFSETAKQLELSKGVLENYAKHRNIKVDIYSGKHALAEDAVAPVLEDVYANRLQVVVTDMDTQKDKFKLVSSDAKEIVKNNGDTVIRKLCNNDPENITAKTVFEAAVLQDEIAMHLIDQAAKYIGIALATAINMLDPDTIYLCGGMMKNGDDFLNRIKKYTRERQMHLAGRHVAIRPGSKDELNVAKGATLMIQDSGWEFEALSFLY